MPKGREGDRGLWYPSNSPVTSTSWKRVGARSLYRALEGRGDQYRERKRKLVEAVVVITTSGMIFINLQDLPLCGDQTEKGEVKPCQMGCRREGEEERGQNILSKAWEKKSNTLDQSVNPTVKTDPGARYLSLFSFLSLQNINILNTLFFISIIKNTQA